MTIKNIFFDMGGTLVHRPLDTQTALIVLLRRAGYEFSEEDFSEAYGKARLEVPAQPPSEPGHPPPRDGYKRRLGQGRDHSFRRLRATMDHLGLDYSDEIITGIVAQDFNAPELYPDTLSALEMAKSSGYKLGVISNWDPGLIRFCMKIGIHDYFDTIIASRALGYKKWWPEIFMVALASIGARPEESVHVGDSPGSDAWGALGVGMHPVVIDRDGGPGGLFCPVISSLVETVPLVESM